MRRILLIVGLVLFLASLASYFFWFSDPIAIWVGLTGLVTIIAPVAPKLLELPAEFFKRWAKELGKVDVHASFNWMAFRRYDSGSMEPCKPDEAEAAELAFTLDVFSHKDVSTAFPVIQVTFRKKNAVLITKGTLYRGREEPSATYLNIPSRELLRLWFSVFVGGHNRAMSHPEMDILKEADSVYFEAVDVKGKKRECLITALPVPERTERLS